MNTLLQQQRNTVAEHIRAENAKEWPNVYETFIQDASAYYDVAPFATRFQGITGVKAIYETLVAAFPDFHVDVTAEYDTLGASIREVTITGTHLGPYCGIPPSGRRIQIELAAFYIFGTVENAARLLAERIYFDNEILLRQIRGESSGPIGLGLAQPGKRLTSPPS